MTFDELKRIYDYYTSRLQVAGFKVTIDNHNLGYIHNVSIWRYVRVRPWYWWIFGSVDSPLFEFHHIQTITPDLDPRIGCPGALEMINVFQSHLKTTDVIWKAIEQEVKP